MHSLVQLIGPTKLQIVKVRFCEVLQIKDGQVVALLQPVPSYKRQRWGTSAVDYNLMKNSEITCSAVTD